MKKWIVAAGLLLFALLWMVPPLRELLNGATAPSERAAIRTRANERSAETARLAPPTESPRRSPSPSAALPAGAASQSEEPEQSTQPPAAAVQTAPTNIPLPRFVGGHRANVPPGGALVTGGWQQPDGNRLLMFASPQVSDDGRTILVGSRFLSLPASRLAGGGWERFMMDDAVATEGGVYTADEYKELLQTIGGFDDVDVLSAPSLTTLPGQLATIEIMAERIERVDGKPVLKKDGLSQGIIARQIEGSADIDLAVTAAQFDSGAKNP